MWGTRWTEGCGAAVGASAWTAAATLLKAAPFATGVEGWGHSC